MPDHPPLPIPNKTPVLPPAGLRSVIDFQDVRYFLFDRTALDNPLLLDLEFSDEEISQAQRYAAMYYNEMQPPVETVSPVALPFGMIFLNGISAYLHQAKLMQLQRNNLTYQAGSMEVDINAKRIEALQASYKMFKEEFVTLAADRKRTINLAGAYGHVY